MNRFLVFSHRSLDHSHIEEDLGRVGDFLCISNIPRRERGDTEKVCKAVG
jgi:hypothetical protein